MGDGQAVLLIWAGGLGELLTHSCEQLMHACAARALSLSRASVDLLLACVFSPMSPEL